MYLFCLKLLYLLTPLSKQTYRNLRYDHIIRSSHFFDKKWYLKTYPDVAKAGIDPVQHYLKYGWKEGYNPCSKFITTRYLQECPDVAKAGINPLVHYELSGRKENRCLWLNNDKIFHGYGFYYNCLRKLFRILYYFQIRKNRRARILVHLHLYYVNSWVEIKEYLKNLSAYRFDLIVTHLTDMQDLSITDEIKRFKPETKILAYPNKGFDIGSFIDIISQTPLNKYDIIYHLHSKSVAGKNGRITYGRLFKGKSWFLQLYSGCLGVRNVHKGINLLLNKKKCGLIGAKNLIFTDTPERQELVRAYAAQLNISVPDNYSFIGGSCFGIKAELLRPVQKLNLTIHHFQESRRYIFTLAHAMERLIAICVLNQGYAVTGLLTFYNNHKSFIKKTLLNRDQKEQIILKQLESYGLSDLQILKKDLRSGLHCQFIKGVFHGKKVFIKWGGIKSIVANEGLMQTKYYQQFGDIIPKVYLYNQEKSFIVTEYFEGYNLEELMNIGMNEQTKKQIIRQLKVLREKVKVTPLLHRDIRPANILYSNGKLKLVDFQFAVSLNKNKTYNELPFILENPALFKDLGEEYRKSKNSFDDAYSINKIIKNLKILK